MYFTKKPSYQQQLKIALCEAQNWRCCYCKFTVWMHFGYTEIQDAATVEHVKPKSKGGSDDNHNLVIACFLCNLVRDRASPKRFERTVEKLLSNPLIKLHWHKFTPEQIVLLRKEVEFAAAQDKLAKRENRGTKNYYNKLLRERKLILN